MIKGKEKRWALLGCGGLILACLVCGFLFYVFQVQPPSRNFEIESLLIDVSAFPAGWTPSPQGPQPVLQPATPLGSGGVGAIESTELDFNLQIRDGSGSAFEQIYRLRKPQEAADEFQDKKKKWFITSKGDSTWTTPPEAHIQSLVADQLYFACSNRRSGIFICRMIAQYEEYLVRFDVYMSAYNSKLQLVPIMSIAESGHIVQAIDQRMGYFLKSSSTLSP